MLFLQSSKLGVKKAVTVTQKHIDLIHTLFEYDSKCDYWFVIARNLLNVLKVHQCSSFFKEPVPEELEEYYKVVKEPRDLSLIEIKLSTLLKSFIIPSATRVKLAVRLTEELPLKLTFPVKTFP